MKELTSHEKQKIAERYNSHRPEKTHDQAVTAVLSFTREASIAVVTAFLSTLAKDE